MYRILIIASFVFYAAVSMPVGARGTVGSSASADTLTESQMQDGLLQMLARFSTYMKAGFQPCAAPNSEGEACGCFRGENTMGPDERGVRPNADLSMVCAFLTKYGRNDPSVSLPAGVTWADIEAMAMKSLVFAYSTHKANRLKVCAGGKYWGSTAATDAVWESSLWAMSVAYAAFFLWDRLSEKQRGYVYRLLKAECDYELQRTIPTGYKGDTKAEENGWEADVLAATLGLFPDDPLAPQWFGRLREFAINSYSHRADATDTTIVDPHYDGKRVKDLYRGSNLYDDYTLQNHNYFHTSYQNVVVQELGEAALALKLFQTELHQRERWHTNALMHHCREVMDSVLYHLALADGELAMPNGNDWSLFLYDQITSYTTNACFLRDPHALMLEARAYRQIAARQLTTADGSWLLRPDVGARRMGVQAHRVMMTWLMHHVLPTAGMKASQWADFSRTYSKARLFTTQNIVCAASKQRFACFAWSQGLKSYTGYIAPTAEEEAASQRFRQTNNIVVPFRQGNSGNFLGWYDVEGRKTNAVPVGNGKYQLDDNAWVMNGELQTNDSTLNHRFAIYATPGNAVVYIDNVRATTDCTITARKGGLMAISADEMTRTVRTLHTAAANGDNARQLPADAPTRAAELDGTGFTTFSSPWLNVDDVFGVVLPKDTRSAATTVFAYGGRANNNSILTAKLFAAYSEERCPVERGSRVDRRAIAYYSNVDAGATASLSALATQLATPEDWNGVIVADPDSTRYMLLGNFNDKRGDCTLRNIAAHEGSPVFTASTTIGSEGSTATFAVEGNSSVANTLRFFIQGSGVEAIQAEGDPSAIILRNSVKGRNKVKVNAFGDDGKKIHAKVTLGTRPVRVSIEGDRLRIH